MGEGIKNVWEYYSVLQMNGILVIIKNTRAGRGHNKSLDEVKILNH